MIKLEDLCIDSNCTLLDALKLIDINGQGIVFVQKDKVFLGTLTDGDIRRAIINGANNESCIESFCNKNAINLPVFSSEKILRDSLLSNEISLIPLINSQGTVVDFASQSRLNRFPVMEPYLGGKEKEYVNECLDTNWISSQGSYVDLFESELSNLCNLNSCIATSSGTTALHLALDCLGIGAQDEVIVPNFTFGASVNSIIHSGATPVLVDINHDDWTISTKQILSSITSKTKAIMPVHIYGNPCDMKEIMKIANENNLLVIEDCAEALGASIDGQPVGTFGDAAAFSFFANKVITCGEGGAVSFKNKESLEKAKMLRDHGMSQKRKYWHEYIGYNYRMTNIQAAIGLAQLEQLETFEKNRKVIWNLYNSELIKSGYFEEQKITPGHSQCHWLYTLLIKKNISVDRDILIDELRLSGIDSRPVFFPMDEMPAFKSNTINSSNLHNSKDISFRGFSLPSSVTLMPDEIKWISTKIIKIITKLSEL